MLETDVFELGALHPGDRISERTPGGLRHCRGERLGDDDGPAVDVIGGVIKLRMEGDGQIRRNRPWRRRPDEH